MADRLVLASADGGVRVILAPALGASIAALSMHGRDVLRPADSSARDPEAMGCFVMAPWVNRIADGQFDWDGRPVHLPINAPPHAIHGDVWRRPWRLHTQTDDQAVLEVTGGGGSRGWPWRYRARLAVTVTASAVRLALTLTNEDAVDMPAAVGLHPYFTANAATRLQFVARHIFAPDARTLPTPAAPIPTALDFTAARPALGCGADHGYGGWDGAAMIGATQLAAEGCAYLQLYAPRESDFLCLEPQTAPANAPHLAGQPWARLAPGAALRMAMTLRQIDPHP